MSSWTALSRRYTRPLMPQEVAQAFPKEARELAPKRLALAEEALRAYYNRYIAPAVQRAHPKDRPIVELLVTARWPNWEVISELSNRIKHLRRIVAELRRREETREKRLSQDAIERAKQYPLEDLCHEYGIALRPSGRVFKALCPFHPDHRPSFIVWPESNTWHCFGCQKGGDPISFLRELKGLSFREAVEELAR